MKKKTSKSLTRKQLAELEAIAAMPDSEIDTSDVPEVLDWTGAKRGLFYRPVKQQLTLRLDADLIAWFKTHSKGGKGYQTRMNRALREYVLGHEGPTASSELKTESKSAEESTTADATTPYSELMKRAEQIARSLSHKSVSYDHFILALTMHRPAWRLVQRVGDPAQLRATAMWRLAKNYTRANTGKVSPEITSDLAELTSRARNLAAQRHSVVAIQHLIDALPKVGGRLDYGSDQQPADADFVTVAESVHNVIQGNVMDELRRTIDAYLMAARQEVDEQFFGNLAKQGADDQAEFSSENRRKKSRQGSSARRSQ